MQFTISAFRYADLRVANLSGADLRFAALPDGFTGKTQEEQIQHLKAIEIPGLKI